MSAHDERISPAFVIIAYSSQKPALNRITVTKNRKNRKLFF